MTSPEAIFRIVIIALAAIVLGACSESCTNTIVSRMDAPGAEFSAVLFQRDCGATSGYSTQISVIGKGDDPIGGGNAFRADDDHGAAEVARWGGPWVKMRWIGSRHLLVRYAAGSRIFEQDDEVAGVKITYQPVNRSDQSSGH